MDLILLELIFWGGLLLFFLVLKDGLGQVETDIEKIGMLSKKQSHLTLHQFVQPERTVEPIGQYGDTQIYRYVVIGGRTYQFDRILPAESLMPLDLEERVVAPGLVYQECKEEDQLPV